MLGNVKSTNINIAGQTKTGMGLEDIALASFRCDGTLRWAKIMGSGTYNDYPLHMRTDMIDGVYIAVGMRRGPSFYPVYIDNDMTISSPDQRNVYLIKYDTSGGLKWVRAPQADTVAYTANSAIPIDMDVDSAGNTYWLCQLPPGEYGGTTGFVATTQPFGDYMLKYDRSGIFTGAIKWETGGCYGSKLTREHKTGKTYLVGITGGNPLPIGNTAIAAQRGYIACFDKDGKYLWNIQSQSAGIIGRPVLDNAGNIYLGGSIAVPFSGDPNANFNGYIAVSKDTLHALPFVIKIDSNRKTIWGTNVTEVGGTTFTSGIALRNSGEIILAGHGGRLKWSGYDKDTFTFPPATGYRPYITGISTQTGRVLALSYLLTDYSSAYSSAVVSDGRNNCYLGGQLTSQLTVKGNALTSIGGETDWFVAKYGHNNCNCTNVPEPKFTMTRSGQAISFKYTGTSYSSIEWDFGDGNTSNLKDPSHTFTDSILYIPCVKVTNACGSNTFCAIAALWPDEIKTIEAFDNIKIYPNPVSSQLIIEGINKGIGILLTDMTGRKIFATTSTDEKTIINTESLWVGAYILQLIDEKGNRTVKTIVKQ